MWSLLASLIARNLVMYGTFRIISVGLGEKFAVTAWVSIPENLHSGVVLAENGSWREICWEGDVCYEFWKYDIADTVLYGYLFHTVTFHVTRTQQGKPFEVGGKTF
jgi:hypothetical protein